MRGGHLLPQSVIWVPPCCHLRHQPLCIPSIYLWTEIRRPYQSRGRKYRKVSHDELAWKQDSLQPMCWNAMPICVDRKHKAAHSKFMAHLTHDAPGSSRLAGKTAPMCWNSIFADTRASRKMVPKREQHYKVLANPKVATDDPPDTLLLPP